jgi:hypothetical protein
MVVPSRLSRHRGDRQLRTRRVPREAVSPLAMAPWAVPGEIDVMPDMGTPVELFGLTLDSHLPNTAIATAIVVVVEYIDPETSKEHLRLMSTDLPVWRRIGLLETVLATDRAEAAAKFEADDED